MTINSLILFSFYGREENSKKGGGMVGYGTGQGGASVWQLQCPVRTQYAGARLASNLALSAHCLEMSFTDSLLYLTGLCTCECVPGYVCV